MMKTSILAFLLLAALPFVEGSICVPLFSECVREQMVAVCYKAGAFTRALHAGWHGKSPLEQCLQHRVTSGGDPERYTNVVVGVKDSKVTFPLITVQYAICPALHQDRSGCLHNVSTLLRSVGRRYEDFLIEYELANFMNSFMSNWTTEEAYLTRFAEIDDLVREALQANIDALGMPLFIVRVGIPQKPVLDEIQMKRFEARAETALIKEEDLRDRKAAAAAHLRRKENATSEAHILNATQTAKHRREEDEIHHQIAMALLKKEVAEAEANATLVLAQAEAKRNELLHTNAFIKLEEIRAMHNNQKVFFGEKIPVAFGATGFFGSSHLDNVANGVPQQGSVPTPGGDIPEVTLDVN